MDLIFSEQELQIGWDVSTANCAAAELDLCHKNGKVSPAWTAVV
jgi:hypothetical protein